MLAKAINLVEPKLSTFDVWTSIIRGEYTLWLAIEDNKPVMCFVSHIIQHPKCRTLCVPYLGSVNHTIDAWLEQGLKALEEYGRMNDCRDIELPGRFGWKKFIEPYGYKAVACVYNKDIPPAPRLGIGDPKETQYGR